MFSDWFWVQNVVFPILGMGMGMTVIFMIYRTIHKVLDRKMGKGLAAGDLDKIRAEIEELKSELGGQIGELHERMDFAERALVSGRVNKEQG